MLRSMTMRGIILGAFAGAWPAMAAPPLTTIQDVLYKADGTRFSGTLTISWNSFSALDNSNIVTQIATVRVVDGNLRVQLVPNMPSTPASAYAVRYNSDGRIQFQETWSVPSSTRPLRVRDVRINSSASGDTDPGGVAGPIPESDVVGLIADLGARPMKGTSYAAGRVAVVDATGMLGSASGAPSDCVRVDGSAGPCGDINLGFVDGLALTGIVDGSNTTFGLSGTPDPVSSVAVYRNGILQKKVEDYDLAGSTVEFVSEATPQPGDTLLASYRTSGSASDTFSGPRVLCSGSGGSTSSPALSPIGSCQIPAGMLTAGNRVEVRFDAAHQGTAGYSIEVRWGATPLVHRDAASGDVLLTGRADGVILASGAQVSSQSWGTVLPFAATVASAGDTYAAGLTIGFFGMTAQGADSVALTNYTVVRIP